MQKSSNQEAESIESRLESLNRTQMFTEIYKKDTWHEGQSESKSGNGSILANTQTIRTILPVIIKGLDIKSMVDAPCGDFNWLQHVQLPVEQYIGCDIVPDLIANNQKLFANQHRQFICVDIVSGTIPTADLLFSRDCLQHLKNKDVFAILNNFKSSGSKYLLTSSHINNSNTELPESDTDRPVTCYRMLNLRLAPFNFPKPLLMIPEDHYPEKSMSLWDINDLPI